MTSGCGKRECKAAVGMESDEARTERKKTTKLSEVSEAGTLSK